MIRIENLHFRYPKKSPLFSALSWEIPTGNIVGLLGKNGAGKSSFLRVISGLLFPQKGAVIVEEYSPKERQPEFLKEVFFVPDECYLPASLTPLNYEKITAPFYPRFDSDRFKSLLGLFEVGAKIKIKDLSFGQQKKVVLAFALSSGCSLILLDEPTNGLDISSKATFRKELVSVIREDQTVVIGTHLVKDLENILDRVVILDQGRIKLDANLSDLADGYYFGIAPQAPREAIFVQSTTLGVQYIEPRESQSHSSVNLELLFQAVIKGSDFPLLSSYSNSFSL
ncbi:ABC transporter ATP-binding protein [Algoriphagus sp.]|uniref:ABC transporter ATP-binding protein n=1 Tax=Algoriphagus sp. TaxID=1872435 RepID=UPI0026310306|nr:ABC transporter ATP-binding protein [Algoriphagus sp.]